MARDIRFSNAAKKDLRSMPKHDQLATIARTEELADDPLTGTEPLQGKHAGRRKARVGDYRIVFTFDLTLVLVLRVMNRQEDYR
jgi:mRNA-degrading endonuclease RelE of RelBE toxin-antitoxin system